MSKIQVFEEIKIKDIFLVITIGGDGNLLYVSKLFQKEVPTVVSFSSGTRNFLTYHDTEDYKEVLTELFTDHVKGVKL